MLVMVTGGIGGGECECIISCKCGAGQCYIQSVTVSHSAWLQVIGVYILNCFMWLLQHTQKHTVSRAFCPTNTSPAPPSLSPSTPGGFMCWFCEFEWKNVVWLYTLFCGVKWPLIVFQISREVKWRTGRAGPADWAPPSALIININQHHTLTSHHTTGAPRAQTLFHFSN